MVKNHDFNAEYAKKNIRAHAILAGYRDMKELAKDAGINYSMFLHRLNGRNEWKLVECRVISKLLKIPIQELFFKD